MTSLEDDVPEALEAVGLREWRPLGVRRDRQCAAEPDELLEVEDGGALSDRGRIDCHVDVFFDPASGTLG